MDVVLAAAVGAWQLLAQATGLTGEINGSLNLVGYGLVAVGSGIGIGIVVGNAITAMVRQPEMEATVRTTMFLGIAFTEALALLGFVLFFIG